MPDANCILPHLMEERTLTEELIGYDTSNAEGIKLCAGFVKGWLESRDIVARQIGVRDLPVTMAEVGPAGRVADRVAPRPSRRRPGPPGAVHPAARGGATATGAAPTT